MKRIPKLRCMGLLDSELESTAASRSWWLSCDAETLSTQDTAAYASSYRNSFLGLHSCEELSSPAYEKRKIGLTLHGGQLDAILVVDERC